MRSTLGGSVESQTPYCLPTVISLTGLSGSETGLGLRPSRVKKPCTSETVDVGETIDPQDIRLAVLVQLEKLKEMKEQEKIADPSNLSRKGRTNSIPRCGSGEGGWVFTEEMLQRVP